MNFLTAFVEIKVDTTKLSAQLAKAKAAVTRTVTVMKDSFKKMATAFKASFDKMVTYAKWGSLAIAGAMALATRAAMKQEDAVFLLGAALRATGEYSQKLMEQFQSFASAIQQVTTYGDEEVLMLMQLLKTLGVSTSRLKAATMMTIGLAAATGRSANTMATYVAMAEQGEFTMLRRYIPALRTASTDTEKMTALTEFASRGFKIAQAQAETTSGALTQMRNAVGDVAEEIGFALLPTIKSSAKAIKEWAQTNQERIGYWAKRSAAYVTFVINVLMDFAKYMVREWPKSLQTGFNVALEFFKGFGESIVVIIKRAALEAGEAFTQAFSTKVGKWLIEKSGLLDLKGGKLGLLAKYPLTGALRIKMMELGTKMMEKGMEPPTPAPDISKELERIWKSRSETIKGILKEANFDISKSQQKLMADLKAIEAEYRPTMWKQMTESAKNYHDEWSESLDQIAKKVQTTSAAEVDILKQVEETINSIRHLDYMTRMERIKYLRDYQRQHQEALKSNVEAAKRLSEEIQAIERSRVNQVAVYLAELREDMQSFSLYYAEQFANAARSIESSMSSAFQKIMEGGRKMRDVLSDFARDIMQAYMKMLAATLRPG